HQCPAGHWAVSHRSPEAIFQTCERVTWSTNHARCSRRIGRLARRLRRSSEEVGGHEQRSWARSTIWTFRRGNQNGWRNCPSQHPERRESVRPSCETPREPPEGDRVEVASIRRDPAAQKKFSHGCPDGAETDPAHRRVFALHRLSHLLQRSPPAFSRPLTGRRVDLRRSRLRTVSELNTSRTRTSTCSGPFPGLIRR